MATLWFAFRLYLWLIDSQQVVGRGGALTGCDLLSDCIFDLLIHSVIQPNCNRYQVVICFQIVSLTYWFTAQRHNLLVIAPLWFAFRLYLWLIDSQQIQDSWKPKPCCDLLSDCIFDLLIHSNHSPVIVIAYVVICFQIVSLTYWFTAVGYKCNIVVWLWFAFRLYLWLIDSQRWCMMVQKVVCCDLLSDCIFDLLIHSALQPSLYMLSVVICFQIVSLTYWFTAFVTFYAIHL